MYKKIELWIVLLLSVLFLVILILYGSLLKSDFNGSKRFPKIQKIASFLADIPKNTKEILNNYLDPGEPLRIFELEHRGKERFIRYFKKERDELLVLPRYDYKSKRSIIEIIDLNTFKVIHQYSPDINEINKKTDTSRFEFSKLNIDHHPNRFKFEHPILLYDGSIISHSQYSPLFKIDYCGQLLWVNDHDSFHHAINIDNDNALWIPSKMYPYSNFVKNYRSDKNFIDDAITKVNLDGEIVFQLSLAEILYKNNIIGETIFKHRDDPLHLNDIEPVLFDGPYWKKGDLFLSIRDLGIIALYRPDSNKIIYTIVGSFSGQHDVDIISDKEISIFNNNNIGLKDSKNSEILIYDFEKKKLFKKFSKTLSVINFKTDSEGLAEYFDDGSILLEEQNRGRLILINSSGDVEWEYVNKDDKDNIYAITWSRIIKDKSKIKKIRDLSKNKCN